MKASIHRISTFCKNWAKLPEHTLTSEKWHTSDSNDSKIRRPLSFRKRAFGWQGQARGIHAGAFMGRAQGIDTDAP